MNTQELINQNRQRIEDVFRYADRDYDGQLDMAELGDVMRSLGLAPSKSELETFGNELNGETFSMNDFIQVVSRFIESHKNDKPLKEKLREAFDSIDRDGTGSVPAKELHHVLVSVGERLSMEEANRLFEKHEINKETDTLSFERFEEVFGMQNDPFGIYNK